MKKVSYPVVFVTLLFVCFGLVGLHTEAATLSGRISFEGDAPARKRIRMRADPKCAALHRRAFYFKEVIVGDDGELSNVFIHVKSGLEKKRYPVPREAVVFDQKGCWYEPHVLGIQVGQTLEILNSDPTTHNVNASPEFNAAMPSVLKKITKKFKKANVMLKVKCNVHPWMTAFVGVMEHPFFSVSGEDGAFEIADLPAGDYVIEAWHEKLGTMTQEITIGEDESKEILFTFQIE